MSYYTGFYQPEEDGGRKKDRGGNHKKVEYRDLFILITEKTGWSPNEIRELTIAQINEYVVGWNEAAKNQSKNTNDTEDIEMFNLTSGISAIKKKTNGS